MHTMALYELIRLFSVLLGTFLSFYPLLYECKKLDGYKFPVYSTESCPRNQTEWKERSSAINCTQDNGYLCFPNEKLTQLLEFCHRARFIWIQEGYCLYLKKDDSTIYSYSCSSFQSGCHNSSFPSYDLFKHSSCTSIGNGCFLAEPSCRGLRETTEPIHVEIVTRNYITTVSTDEKTNQTLKHKDSVNYDESSMMPTLLGVLLGVFILIAIFCMLWFKYRKGYHICGRKGDIESSREEECNPLFPTTDLENTDIETHMEESPLDQAIFKQWQEDNDSFISTRACNQVEQLIKSQNLVVVTGNSGSGKSAIIQHVALSYRSDGWTVKPVYSVKEIIDTWSRQDALDRRALLVFNDPIGNESFDEEKYKLWKDHEEKLKDCFRKIKMLVSCRRYILRDARVRGILKDNSCIIDLSGDQHKLNIEEKQKILESYSSKNECLKEDINDIIKTEEYFPLLCKLYFSDKNKQKLGLRFFKEPFDVCEEQIRNFRKECPKTYCALVLLVLFNNQLCIQDIQKSEQSKNKFKLALKLCEMIPTTAPHSIGDTLETLRGFFVKKIGHTYLFYHDFVNDVTAYLFGTNYPQETIQYADIGFLRRRVNLKSRNNTKKDVKNDDKIDKFTICLNDEYANNLGERLYSEIFGERMLDVVLNPCMRNEKLATFFIQKLKKSPDELNKLLAKKHLQENFSNQEDDRLSSEQSFKSKIDFFYYKEVPILSYIIVFCHTNVSKHCLEALQRLSQNYLEGTSLFSAVCCNGSMDLFKVFTKEQIKTLTMETWGQYYPIHIVSLFHNHEILRELIQVKNDVNLSTVGKYGYTPLMLAAINTDTSEQNNKERNSQSIDCTVELLLTNGADVNSGDPILGSPLHMASGEGNDYTVELLLGKRANINTCSQNIENTPLHEASEKRHYRTVQLLLYKKADINSRDKNKKTPLHKASEQGHESTVLLLLDKGADVNPWDTNKKTPLHQASQLGHKGIVQLLLDKGAIINSSDKNKETPLHKATKRGHESIVQLLLDKGANINSRDTNEETPLHKAIIWRHESIVKLLLDRRAISFLLDKNKESPLHKAIKLGYESIVQLLLDKGANIESLDKNEETPLHKAIIWKHERIVQILLDKGADINSWDKNRESPLHKAIKLGYESIVQLLLDKGADINLWDKNKETPLHKASKWGHESIVQLLLDKGAYINLCDKNKKTPLHRAIKGGHERVVQLLLDRSSC